MNLSALIQDAIDGARYRLPIVAPWVKRLIVNDDFVGRRDRLASTRVRIHIGYGMTTRDAEHDAGRCGALDPVGRAIGGDGIPPQDRVGPTRKCSITMTRLSPGASIGSLSRVIPTGHSGEKPQHLSERQPSSIRRTSTTSRCSAPLLWHRWASPGRASADPSSSAPGRTLHVIWGDGANDRLPAIREIARWLRGPTARTSSATNSSPSATSTSTGKMIRSSRPSSPPGSGRHRDTSVCRSRSSTTPTRRSSTIRSRGSPAMAARQGSRRP